jgi:NAD(P)-dependent dehydrogenase (short-subunit alcohol dehydrogenase family)
MRVLVTGSQRGLGLELCRALAARGDDVLASCLVATPELRELDVEALPGIDVSSDSAVAGLGAVLRAGPPLDLVISNAGINDNSGGPADADTVAMMHEFSVNTLGAVRVVRTVLPHLSPRARIALITTGRGALFPPSPAHGANYGYRISKAALNVFGGILAADLRERGICVVLVHPGVLDTDLLRRASGADGVRLSAPGALSADAVAPIVLRRIAELPLERSGAWVAVDGAHIG